MDRTAPHQRTTRIDRIIWWLPLPAFALTIAGWPRLPDGFLFDDYPNILDNHGVQPDDASAPSPMRAI